MYLFARPRFQHLYLHANTAIPFRSYPIRNLYATSNIKREADQLSQGHATDPNNLHPQDVQSEVVRKGKEARKDYKSEAIDAANEATGTRDEKPSKTGQGNPEGVGFVEQVGGASGTARKFEELENGRK